MKILTTPEMRLLESQEINQGTPVEVIMERAGWEASRLISREYPYCRSVHIWVGRGNNGGDGLVIARALASLGWEVNVWLIFPESQLSPLALQKLAELRETYPELPVQERAVSTAWPRSDEILVDALLGIGVSGEVRGEVSTRIEEINRARRQRFFRVVAIDCPSGICEGSVAVEETASGENQAVVADLTVTIGYGKEFLFREELATWVGRILVAPVFQLQPIHSLAVEAIVPWEIRPALPRRSALVYKNDLGRVLVIGGSAGMTGAPRLTAQAALEAGAGLVNLGVRPQIYPIVAASASPQIMVLDLGDDKHYEKALSEANVLAVGPGLGLDTVSDRFLRSILGSLRVPLILDADALTLLAKDLTILKTKFSPLQEFKPIVGRPPIILTPHPGEMRRLLGREFTANERLAVAQEFAQTHDVYLVLKGARTIVAHPDGKVWVNTSGNPGLATGGSGDTLLGILAALIAQGVACEEAPQFAVWWHGRAADLALRQRGCEEGLSAEEVLRHLPQALNDY